MQRYNEFFGIEYNQDYSWYNGIVSMDSPLFIDPLLLKKTSEKEFAKAYNKIVDFFTNAIIKTKDRRISKNLKKNMLYFEEKKELSLGYSFATNEGAGIKYSIASQMLDELSELLDNNVFQKENFEAIQLFASNIDHDRMTDIISNIIEYEIATYTNRICNQLNIQTKKFSVKKDFDFDQMCWNYINIELPFHNLKNEEEYILLVPKDILVTEMNCNKERFIKYIRTYHNPYMVETFGYNLKKDIEKNYNQIIKKITENDEESIISGFIENYNSNVYKYDFIRDFKGIINWYNSAKNILEKIEIVNKNDINIFANEMIDITRNIIENNGGYKFLLNSKGNLKREPQIGLYILDIFIALTSKSTFKITAESNHGTGALDYLLTDGENDVCIELKKSGHDKVLETVKKDKQLHQYMKDHYTKYGCYIVIYRNEDITPKMKQISINKRELENNGYIINCHYINASDKESASRL